MRAYAGRSPFRPLRRNRSSNAQCILHYEEYFTEDRVRRVKRQDLQRYVWPVSLPREPLELLIHHQVIADAALEDRLIEYDCQLMPRFARQHLLALHPDLDQPLYQGWR